MRNRIQYNEGLGGLAGTHLTGPNLRPRDGLRYTKKMNEEEYAWLNLACHKGVGGRTLARLVAHFPTLNSLQRARNADLVSLVGSRAAKYVMNAVAANAMSLATQRQVELSERIGAKWIVASSPDYPPLLRLIADKPALLCYRGQLEVLRALLVASVGTRHPSSDAAMEAEATCSALARGGACVVSGLAKGIDFFSHTGAVEVGRTVAVLGSGVDWIYPKEHTALASQILERGGAIVSEQLLGTPPRPANLVQRNRIISALAACVLVWETDVTGGTMHTVDFAVAQGRQLFAFTPTDLPGALTAPKQRGIRLILERGWGRPFRGRADVQEVIRVATCGLNQLLVAGQSGGGNLRAKHSSDSPAVEQLSLLEASKDRPGERDA